MLDNRLTIHSKYETLEEIILTILVPTTILQLLLLFCDSHTFKRSMYTYVDAGLFQYSFTFLSKNR